MFDLLKILTAVFSVFVVLGLVCFIVFAWLVYIPMLTLLEKIRPALAVQLRSWIRS